jgi:glycosyltransferase involved in cell wall biosynthesis
VSDVVALVAARDESDRVGDTVTALRSIPTVTHVVVVDDGSADDTAARAIAAGARVLRSAVGRGKGQALEAAIATIERPDAWLLADGDLGSSAAALSAVLEPVVAGRADIVVAVVPPGVGGGFGLVKRFAAAAIRRFGGITVEEPLSGQRALTSRAMDAVRPLARGFAVETAMTIDAARAGLRVLEVPAAVTHRPTYLDIRGFAHRGRQGIDIARAVTARLGRPR